MKFLFAPFSCQKTITETSSSFLLQKNGNRMSTYFVFVFFWKKKMSGGGTKWFPSTLVRFTQIWLMSLDWMQCFSVLLFSSYWKLCLIEFTHKGSAKCDCTKERKQKHVLVFGLFSGSFGNLALKFLFFIFLKFIKKKSGKQIKFLPSSWQSIVCQLVLVFQSI